MKYFNLNSLSTLLTIISFTTIPFKAFPLHSYPSIAVTTTIFMITIVAASRLVIVVAISLVKVETVEQTAITTIT